MKIKFKKLDIDAVIPRHAKVGDAGVDLVATSKSNVIDNIITYGTSLAVEIPEGYVGLIFPRSSIYKYDMYLTNSVGVIDSGYRGEIMIKFAVTEGDQWAVTYPLGERICQMVIVPFITVEAQEVEELSVTERNTGAYGSTGN